MSWRVVELPEQPLLTCAARAGQRLIVSLVASKRRSRGCGDICRSIPYGASVRGWSVGLSHRTNQTGEFERKPSSLSRGDRGFESCFLRYDKRFYLVYPISYVLPMHVYPQVHPQRFCRCRWTSLDDLGRFLLAASRLVANAVLRRHEISGVRSSLRQPHAWTRRINSAQRSSTGKVFSAGSGGKVVTTRSTAISR